MKFTKDKGKKFLSVILMTVMVMGLLPQMTTPVYAALLIINKAVNINTVPPVNGADIIDGTNAITGATIPVVTWSADNGTTWTAANGIFAPNTVYKTKYVYTTAVGNKFDSSIAISDITLPGRGWTIDSTTVSTESRIDDTLTIIVTWPVTTINATVLPGTSTGLLKVNVSSQPTDHFEIVVRRGNTVPQSIGTLVPTETVPYVSGDNFDILKIEFPYIPSFDEYTLYLYDVDAQGIIVGYYDKEVIPSDINLDCPFSGGDGTENNPYQVETPNQLKYVGLMSLSNNGNHVTQNNFILNNDIDLDVAPFNEGQGWPSILFVGNFDGNGKTIKNLMIKANKPSEDGLEYTGLFSAAILGTIKNLSITNANVSGYEHVGILAGSAGDEHIENVFVTGNVTGAHYIGGLLGVEERAAKTVVNCYSLANVSGSGAVGGLVGKTDSSTIKTSYAVGQVSIINPNEDIEEESGLLFKNLHGGLVGFDSSAVDINNTQNVYENNYYDANTTGQLDTIGATPEETSAMKLQGTFVGFDFDTVWEINPNKNGGYPYLQGLVPYLEQAAPTNLLGVAPTASANNGKIVKDPQQDKNAPETILNNSTEELGSALFTTEELAKIKAGEDAKVILKVIDISDSVSEADKKLIAANLKEDSAVMYIDLSLYKKIGNGTETKITETKNKISISIEVPVELRSTDMEKKRTYQIVRIHDGVVTILEGTYDPVTHLLTFETDRFSTYALAYKDTHVDTDASGKDDEVAITKDFSHLRLTAKAAETSQNLTYTKVSGADGYIIYGALCGSNNKMVKLTDVSGDITSYILKGLKKATYYKYQIQAYKIVNGKKVVIATSKVIHSITTSKYYVNPTKVISDTSAVILAVGSSKKVTCNVVLPDSKKMKNHTNIIRYETTNKTIATVTESGKIKAMSRGICYIYAYAQNGAYKKIKVTIK